MRNEFECPKCGSERIEVKTVTTKTGVAAPDGYEETIGLEVFECFDCGAKGDW